MPAKVYTDKDADLKEFKNKTLAVIGFGSQGHAHALNLKESGCKVIIGLYPKSKSRPVAQKLGFKVYDTAAAVKKADVIMVGVPDMKQAEVYEKDIAPNLTKGKCLLFSHGLTIHYGLIQPPEDVDVIMVAPKGPGHVVRSQFQVAGPWPSTRMIPSTGSPSRPAGPSAMRWSASMRVVPRLCAARATVKPNSCC
jgi:ketol-acid reductoisomerase